MSDWTPLRDFLRDDMAAQLDNYSLTEPDRRPAPTSPHTVRPSLERLTDQAELIALRVFVAERHQHEQHVAGEAKLVHLVNGHRWLRQ